MPWRRSSVEMMSRSFWPSEIHQSSVHSIETLVERVETYCFPFPEVFPGRRLAVSQLWAPCISVKASTRPVCVAWSVPLHSNPSCSLKNSLNAGSSFKAPSSLGTCAVLPVLTIDRRLSAAVGFDERHRHNCARSPSNCFRPFLILLASEQER